MLKNYDKLYVSRGRRLILVADDEMINREMLGEILKNDYQVLYASDGEETLDKIHQYKDTLSLVLLDILMPGMSGLEILEEVKKDALLSRIPIIVLTAEKSMEVESLRLGASDFIPKPYPAVDVIHARVRRTIELSEDRDIIRSTEKDALTGLYNKEFFYRYAAQLDQFNPDQAMDAVIIDVNHFRMVNERYGRAYGDQVLRKIGKELEEIAGASGAIACRREADSFMIYCPHRDDYEEIMDHAQVYLAEEDSSDNRIRLRMGVYSHADKGLDLERRFDRAKMAADTVKGSFTNNIGFYDDKLHEKQLYAEQLIEDFPAAIREKQFKVYYQPKFDVRPDTPILISAEALVRWDHPDLGMVSPGFFIPLFEDNGLIQQLDHYVWKETARQIRVWKDQLNYSVPISVNVSRIDMYDPKLSDIMQEIIDSQNLSGSDFLLELTESAYTQDSAQIIETSQRLRKMGFHIEMDDFGTGYSSLNMLSSLPIDALKLDIQFIRNAFKEGGDTHMLEVIIGISDFLSVPVIAEGVETEDQLHALKSLGCDIVQGYFFSKPVPAADFEPFILQKKEADLAREEESRRQDKKKKEEAMRQAKLELIRKPQHTEEEDKPLETLEPAGKKEHTGIQLRTASIFFVILAVLAAGALMLSNITVTRGYQRMEMASDRYIEAQMAASNMESGSDYLTDRVRCFVVTGQIDYLEDFIEEVEITRTRDKAVESLEKLLNKDEGSALESLNTALDLSNELIQYEHKAMRLILETGDYNMSEVPESIADLPLTEEEKQMTKEQLKKAAQTLVFDNNYMLYKDKIRENVRLCTQELIRSSSRELEHASARLALLVNVQTLITILFLVIVLAIVAIITKMIRIPLTNMVRKMQGQEMIPPTGVEELRFVTRTYNQILKENQQAREKLSHEASHDALTGLFNRGAYDLLIESADTEHIALILIDVDYFKSVNDTYGHAVGDRVLKRVADLLKASFRSVDILCRIGGDEFAVVMTRSNSSMSQLVMNKMGRINEILQHPKDDLPPVSISVGVAFSDRENPRRDIFRDADSALYKVKEAGRKGCAVFDGK